MHEIDIENFDIRTDMIIDRDSQIKHNHKNIKLEDSIDPKTNEIYKTISFKDITDKYNYQKVLNKVTEEFKKVLKYEQIKKNDSCLIVGLGNIKSTPDSLGPKTLEKILVTRHLFTLGKVEDGYRNVSIFTPGVTGVTGIETKDSIIGIIKKTKPKFIIAIDSLASSNIAHLNKIVQISNSGISPGSGIGNNRDKIDKKSLKIPIIVIGVPTVVDEATIVYDTIKELKINVDKRVVANTLFLVNYNLIVTPKDIDFQIEKLSSLIATAINKGLHDNYNSTK